MKNPILNGIIRHAVEKLCVAYGFCGQAAEDDNAVLNSTDRGGKDIKIVITVGTSAFRRPL